MDGKIDVGADMSRSVRAVERIKRGMEMVECADHERRAAGKSRCIGLSYQSLLLNYS